MGEVKRSSSASCRAVARPTNGFRGLALGPNKYSSEKLPKTLLDVEVLDVVKKKSGNTGKGESVKYKVHYLHLRPRHVAMVDEILEDNEANRKRKRDLDLKLDKMFNKKTKKGTRKGQTTGKTSVGGKEDSDHHAEGAIECNNLNDEGELKLSLSFPASLKTQLRDDYSKINQKSMLAKLPADISIEEILKEFLESESASFENNEGIGKIKPNTLEQIIDGLIVLFNNTLKHCLLYKFERLQFESVLEKHPERDTDHLILSSSADEEDDHLRLSQVYGLIHLLRLLCRLPDLLRIKDFTKLELDNLIKVLNLLLKYIGAKSRKDRFFSSDMYIQASVTYKRVFEDMEYVFF